ncbi:MAG: 3-methyl-2-oxobutanoate hydroxymethyltransferase [Myxococcales bacterium]|nr:3-methyl-2-oxobutanoate hydroxymethyltransferase [Myxococcales bacterium]
MYGSHRDGDGTARAALRRRITAPELRCRKGREPITMVTAYDFTMARLLDDAGIDVLLVGDSLGMVVQGHDNTLPVTLDEICYHTRCVARGARYAHVVGDLPFMSYQVSPQQAVESAGKLVKEGLASSVKLEGGADVAEHVARIVRCGIPVMGHVGLTPQSVHALGGFKVQGKSRSAAKRIIADAIALTEAGVYAIVLEAMPAELAAQITEAVGVPTIGIGAGPDCDGQVLVSYDLFGMNIGHAPKFAKAYANVGDTMRDAAKSFAAEVRARSFPAPEHCYASDPIAPKAKLVAV